MNAARGGGPGPMDRLKQTRGMKVVLGGEPTVTPPSTLGYVLASFTAAVTGIAFIAAKPVLDYLDPLSFSISQFGIASLFSFAWLAAERRLGELTRLTPGQWTFLVVISVLFLSAIYSMWIALAVIPATSASLLNRLEVPVTVLLGMALFGDRFTKREATGAGITLLGVVVLRYDAPPSFNAGFWMMMLSSTLFGVSEILVKTRVHAIPPKVFAFVRNFFVFALCLLAAVWRVAMQDPPGWRSILDWDGVMRGLPLIAAAALVGPVVARTAYMYTLRHLDISRAALIQQAQPVFVAVFSALLLRALPSRREWVGGILIILGCLFLVQWRRMMTRVPRTPAAEGRA